MPARTEVARISISRHLKRLEELSGSLREHRIQVEEISEEISRHKPGPADRSDEAYAVLGLRLQEASAAVREDEQEAGSILGWLAWDLGIGGVAGGTEARGG